MSPSPTSTIAKHRAPTASTQRVRPKGNAWPLFRSTLRSLLLTKRTPILFLVLLVPTFVTLGIYPFLDERYEAFDGTLATSGNAGLLWFQDATIILYMGLLIPLVTAFFATGLIGDEVANKTLPYIFTRPVRRFWIFLSKFSAFAVGTYALIAMAILIIFFLALSASQNPWRQLDDLFVALGVALLAVLSFGSLFALFGVGIRFPLVAAMSYFLLWENVFGNFPAQIKRVTLIFYERSILIDYAGRPNFIDDFLGFSVEPGVAIAVLVAATAAFLAASSWLIGRRDYGV